MSILPIKLYDSPELRRISEKVDDVHHYSLWILANDLLNTMRMAGGIGLAANQVGREERMAVIQIDPRKAPIVMVNPTIHEQSKILAKGVEGCLSFPNVTAQVSRSKTIELSYYDPLDHGEVVTTKLRDLEARVVQHEIDHLEGRMFFDLLTNREQKRVLKEYDRLKNERIKL